MKGEKEYCLIDGLHLEDFLRENQNKNDFIRKNVLTATRNFDHRVKNFIKTIVMSKFNEMHIKFYNFRVEFQMRGAGHIHGVLWVDFEQFNLDERNKDLKNVKAVLDEIGNENSLSAEEESILARFADKFITCSLKDPDTKDIVQEVNVHHHTRACRKYNTTNCRFHFPRFPVNETLVSVPARIKYPDESIRKEMINKAKCALKKLKKC